MELDGMQAKMPLSDDEKRRLILGLVTRLRCAECGQPYAPKDFALVHRYQDVWVLSTRCRHCDDACHVVVFMRLDADPEPGVDLTPEELREVDQWPPITADDVLDVHELLQEFDGDFQELFAS
jgi:hypothetical protein